jgi:ribose 5-phosphate isomerase A
LKDARAESIEKIGRAISSRIKNGALVGLGSGSTIAALLPTVAAELRQKGVRPRWVPTSVQITLVAQGLDQEMGALDRPSLDLAVDGADQIDSDLNLIKGGGGALFKEKVVIGSARRTLIVADERKLAQRLCSGGAKVPVEAHPFARVPVAQRLKALGGEPSLKLGERGFPFYTENGNVLFDTAFPPVKNPSLLESKMKSIPGVVEAGIFTPRPIEVYVIQEDGGYRILKKE